VLFDLLVSEADSNALPWAITVHFQRAPLELLDASLKTAESLLLNALKESCYLCCGSSLPAMSLSAEDQERLKKAVAMGDYEVFREVKEQVQRGVASQLGAASSGSLVPRSIPVRVYTDQSTWRQLPVAPMLDDGRPCLVSHLLARCLPHAFGHGADATAARMDILVQGVPCPTNAQLLWLSRACSHPDGFLYICVRRL